MGMPRNSQAFELKRYSAQHTDLRPCEWPGCDDTGEHRAPRSRSELNSYRWFCLDHAREYNRAWNYYEGMTDDEVEADVRRDTTWHRPSWPLGSAGYAYTVDVEGWLKDFGLIGKGGNDDTTRRAAQRFTETPETEAMRVLDLEPPLDEQSLKARYKELVKLHHPDANGGDKNAEERFKEIAIAYQILLEFITS